MEILKKFRKDGYFTAELYNLLAQKKINDDLSDIVPSEYQKEMKMTVQQRLKSLTNINVDNMLTISREQKVVLLFIPKLLVFQNYNANDKIVGKFCLKNISKAPTHVNMVFKDSSFFSISPPGGLSTRLAPGIAIHFTLTFTPEHKEDYIHQVTFYTDADQYIFPIIAMGPRPIFDFPDKIDIPKTPLKVENSVIVPVTNVGEVPANCTLSTRSPFSVKPKSIHLKPKECKNIEVKFQTVIFGDSSGTLYALLETGETFRIQLSGKTFTVSIELEKQVVRFFDTFNTMVRQQTFKIINKSDRILTYMCLKNESIYEDFRDKLHLATMFYSVKESESMKDEKLVYYDMLSSDEHQRIYTRIFFDEVQVLVADESLHYRDSHFSVSPVAGNLWPNKATELTITFEPKTIGELSSTLYLDVDGVNDRVPLKLVGMSIPPKINLNIETLDMGDVYISKTYNYEVVAINKGHINGVIEYREVPTLFGSIISCTPTRYCLRPGDKQIFVISFCNANQGPYFEELNFTICDTDVVLKLYLKGELIYPSLSFSLKCLDFGKVSVGYPNTRELDVINESSVSISAKIKISSDGPEVSSISLDDFAFAENPKPQIPQWPREFNIEPCKIDISPQSTTTLKVTLIANLIRTNQTALELEMDKSDSPPIILPIIYIAMVPELTPAPDIDLRVCFLEHPYVYEIIVMSNEFYGYYTLEEPVENCALKVVSNTKEGYIKPNSALCFAVSIMTSVLGHHEYSLRLKLFGLSQTVEICHIKACGVRPIVTCNPTALHWGQVKLLTPLEKSLIVVNDSPVVVNFKATILHKDGRWQISPAEGSVAPESETELTLTLYLIDANTYSNKAILQFEKVKDILVPLTAIGIGTSIIVGEHRDRIKLGRHFTKIPLRCSVLMENHGTKLHILEWSDLYKTPNSKQPVEASFFNVEPKSFKMSAGESMEMIITGLSHKTTKVKETWYLAGSVEGMNKKELLLECDIEAEFVDPKIEVNPTHIEFQYDYGPYSEYYSLINIVTIKNVSGLPLDLEISIRPPFAIVQRPDTYIVPVEDDQCCSCMRYLESDEEVQKLMQNLETRNSPGFIDCLTLKPVERSRNKSLEFFCDIHKIKLAFNLTHMIEQSFADRDTIKLQVLFDTTKHMSLKSKVFCDLLRIKFKGHKNKDAVKVTGNINYPNILVLTPRIEFNCLQNGTIESRTIKIQNVTPVLVCYSLQWKKCSITSTPVIDFPEQIKKDVTTESSKSEAKSVRTGDSASGGVHDIFDKQTSGEKSPADDTIKLVSDKHSQIQNELSYILQASEAVLISDSGEMLDAEDIKLRFLQKITPMIHGKYEEQLPWLHKLPTKAKRDERDINAVMNLMPHRGLLKPGDIQYIHVIFRPSRNICVRGILECEVLGGPPETILITGKSSDLMYKLNTERLNFKIRSFHEHAIEILQLTNIAYLSFNYKTYLIEDKNQSILSGKILELSPPEKLLECEEHVEIEVIVYPGIVGYFNKVFLLELGHLPHIPIQVYGWGQIPQIYLSLQRSEQFHNLDPIIGYKALQMLSNAYLSEISEIFQLTVRATPVNSPLTDKCFEDPDFQHDWHICTHWDGYPSIMDIELAVERYLVIQHVEERPEIMTAFVNSHKTGTIPGFSTIPYVIDFGVVITGNTMQCIAEVINYGPLATKLICSKHTVFPTWLTLKLCGKLNPGETGKLEVIFSPTSADFTELEQDVEFCFNIEVPYGASIPIIVKALCAVPYLVSNVKSIDFGSVKCGEKVMISIPLKNIGKPTCVWFVTLKLKAPGSPAMTIMDGSGVYEPGEGGWLTIAFKPMTEMVYDGVLIFRCHMNPTRFTIPVTGHGIVPALHIIGPKVNFPPTLPWSETSYVYFGLTNPCPFPIELIFAHSDEKCKQEAAIFQLLHKFYNKPDELLIPSITPGRGLPKEITDFCHSFYERVERIKEQEASQQRTKSTTSKSTATPKKPPKPAKGQPKTPVSSKDNAPIKFRSEAEIIADEINFLREQGIDPIKSCNISQSQHCSDESVKDKPRKGLIIFAYGSPLEEIQSQEYAHAIGKVLDIPVVNVDNCIVESLLNPYDNQTKQILINAIDENYESLKRARDDVGAEDHEEFDANLDEFDILFKKIVCIANNRNVQQTPRSKAAPKPKKKSSTSMVSSTLLQAFGSTTLFQMDLTEEILTDYFKEAKFDRGFVVETLTSVVFKNPALVVTTILKCRSEIWNVHLLLCQADVSKWAQAFEEAQREAEIFEEPSKVYDENEIGDIIEKLEDMDEEEYENADPQLKAVYIEHGLAERRKNFFDKKLLSLLSSPMTESSRERTGKGAQSATAVKLSESKKLKGKKEEVKGKVSPEFMALSAKYIEYAKTTYESLINIASNWVFEEGELGFPPYSITGQATGGASAKKPKKKSELQVQSDDIELEERGFPLTLVLNPCDMYKEAIKNMFLTSPDVQAALKTEEEYDILQDPVRTKEFTTLLLSTLPTLQHVQPLQWKFLDEKPISKCECNQFTDVSLLDDSTQESVLMILTKWNCICGKKNISSETFTSDGVSTLDKMVGEDVIDENEPMPIQTVKSIDVLTSDARVILQPGDLMRCKYSFSPQDEGNFSVKRYVEIYGWPASRVEININGICNIPRLDSRPKKMFENFVRRTIEDTVYKLTFLDDLKVFEFGPIFVGSNRVYEEQYSMDLKNSSLITANVDFEFFEETSVFQIDKNCIQLEPGSRGKLTISAAPAEVGAHTTLLLLCVKDNPAIIRVPIACSGVNPFVEILPLSKSIEYGKLLLYRRKDDRFIVKNDSILPIKWKIRNDNDFTEDFIISKTSGIIPSLENQVVPVTYIACRVAVINNKPLIIDIYDSLGRGEPLITGTLTLSAECYDVKIDCAFEKPSESYLNYGNVKVNSTVCQDMFLINRGKYNIFFKLKKVKKFPEPSLIKSFVSIPESGVVPASGKLMAISFECTPTTSINLVNVPAYTCTLLDNSKEQLIVAKFPVCITIASFYNTFTLFPLGELNFHVIPVGTSVLREVILNNTSKCPVTYQIELPEEYRPDPLSVIPAVKTVKDKIKNPPLKCGNFMILNEDNLLAPGTSRTISIQFTASGSETFTETINFIISDTCPAEAQGVPLRLVGTGAMPIIDFWNIENTFREHLIVRTLSDYKEPESSPHCVFVENSVTLHFFCITVKTRFTAYIDLYNNGLVPCALNMRLQHQSNSDESIFSLDKYETYIEPLMHTNLGIIFTPTALMEYRGVLEIDLKQLDNQCLTYKLCLIGEGVIPRIEMIKPKSQRHNSSCLRLPVTCLGSVSNSTILFKNTSSLKAMVVADVKKMMPEKRPVFWITAPPEIIMAQKIDSRANHFSEDEFNVTLKLILKPKEIATLTVHYNPIRKGPASCDVKLKIIDNPYEFYTVICDGEAFLEDVILTGLTMLPMETNVDEYKISGQWPQINTGGSLSSTDDGKKKSRKLSTDIKKSKSKKRADSTETSLSLQLPAVLKYLLDFGGCEVCVLQKKSVVMVNNSEKVYKFAWATVNYIVTQPTTGYISPGEEKDLEIMFYCAQPVVIERELLNCTLEAISDDTLTLDMKGTTWDNRQIITVFEHDQDLGLEQRNEIVIDEQVIPPSESCFGIISIILVYSATTEYAKFKCNLPEEKKIKDTFIYQQRKTKIVPAASHPMPTVKAGQGNGRSLEIISIEDATRKFNFTVKNVGTVPLKIEWSFVVDDEYPARIDKYKIDVPPTNLEGGQTEEDLKHKEFLCESYHSVVDTGDPSQKTNGDLGTKSEQSNVTLYSGTVDRQSVDTWFEIDLPFQIEPTKACLISKESQEFTVTFSPLNAFDFKVKLRSSIENLDPYDQNITCKLTARSLIPYVHLGVEESDYLTSGRRKVSGGVVLPPHLTVLEFNVLGWGCYKKTFSVINPTSDSYEFIFEMVMTDKPELVPIHCDKLKGYVEGGTSTDVTFTFSPTAPGVTESQWKFSIPAYNLVINLLVVGLVREPDVLFVPTILIIRNLLVGFTTASNVILKNNENEALQFEFKGNSLNNESGIQPIVVEPEKGTLKPLSETNIKVTYTPNVDGPLSFKIYCSITYLTKYLTLCVNALSYSIKPKVTYYLIGNEHVLNSEFNTNIYLKQTASTYERKIPFYIKNEGSATFFFDWYYNISNVKEYLQVSVEPKNGHVTPGNDVECTLFFTLKRIPVDGFPVNLYISDGPEYNIFLFAEIEKPVYCFSFMEHDFGKCFINTPDDTYKKMIVFHNGDKVPVLLHLNFANQPELLVDFDHKKLGKIEAGKQEKIPIYFRPKQVKEYEFTLQFWVNSLCEENITIKGEGIPLLFDIYEGCQKSFDLGYVKVGDKVVRTIEVMNYSKMPIDASYIFREMYSEMKEDANSETTSVCLETAGDFTYQPDTGLSRGQMLQDYKDENVRAQIKKDIENALHALKVVPNKCSIKPFRKVSLKIQFKPSGMISKLNMQLNMKVFDAERPLVRLSGCATGMSLCLSQDSLQFGRVRKRACKVLKVMLRNKGDFGARFCWQPLKSPEFIISPMKGHAAAHSNVTFTITYKPMNHNPFVKMWASCNIENYKPLELAMYATCVDIGNVENKVLFLECPVREVITDYIAVTNPTDDLWLVLCETDGGPFDTLKEFSIEANSTFDIPIHFKPMSIGKHECQMLFSPLGDSALFLSLTGLALEPNPNGEMNITVAAKEYYTEELHVYNISEKPESYTVKTTVVKIVPDKFEGYYEVQFPEMIKTWGEAVATCQWTFVCYETCEMTFKVSFINEENNEYQYYNITAIITESPIIDTLTFVSPARETCQKELVIKNLLAEESQYYIQSTSLICPEVLTINGNSETILLMTYQPLVVGVTEELLEITNELVGTYIYKVILKCLPAKQKCIETSACLGETVCLRLRVQNKTAFKADFTCTVSHESILADSMYSLEPYEKGKFLVWFEPTSIGTQNIILSFDSPVAGEFVFNITAKTKDTKPQGPYDIVPGEFAEVVFKNIFTETRTFKILVDKPVFYVDKLYETVDPKTNITIPVYLSEKPIQGWGKPPTGCLTIQVFDPPTPKVSWTYFLQSTE